MHALAEAFRSSERRNLIQDLAQLSMKSWLPSSLIYWIEIPSDPMSYRDAVQCMKAGLTYCCYSQHECHTVVPWQKRSDQV